MTRARDRKLTLNQRLALAAVALGAVAVIGSPVGGSVVTVDKKELATIVERKVDHVTATEFADWIVQGETDYRLIDLRDESEYATYHIPSAEHVLLSELPDYPLERNERIVLYSGGGIHSAQAWFLLKADRYQGVYMLFGGLDAWMDEVLFPSPPGETTPEALAAFDKAVEVSRFFGGTPRTAAEAEAGQAAIAAPIPAAPPTTVIAKPKTRKKRKGC
jgi:rhodanese-related sulfurtransferase